MYKLIVLILPCLICISAQAKSVDYELLTASTTTVIPHAVSDQAVSARKFLTVIAKKNWLTAMSARLKKNIPGQNERDSFLRTVYYEATRAGLDPQLVLSVIQVESGFKKYAVSSAGARGYMQIMPFWVDTIGTHDHNLFHIRVNLRYGCTILRHYLNIERGNYFRALGRYNGNLGKTQYPEKVFSTWRKTWEYAL